MDKEYETIGGVRHEVGTPGHADACKRRDQRRADSRAKRAKLKAELAKQKGRADALEARVKKLEQGLTQAQSPQRLDHAVRVRGAVIRRAQVALGSQFKMDGLSIPAIKIAAVKAYYKDAVNLKGKPLDYVNGMFRAIPSGKRRRDRNDGGDPLRLDHNNQVHGGRVPEHLRQPPPGFQRTDGAPTMADYRVRRDAGEEARHRKPLLVSKSNPAREVDGYPAVQGSMLENMR